LLALTWQPEMVKQQSQGMLYRLPGKVDLLNQSFRALDQGRLSRPQQLAQSLFLNKSDIFPNEITGMILVDQHLLLQHLEDSLITSLIKAFDRGMHGGGGRDSPMLPVVSKEVLDGGSE
jgi:hypothetical protein